MSQRQATAADKRLRYPFPLLALAVGDAGYTIHHASKQVSQAADVPKVAVILCIARVIVLGLVLSLSRRWRTRGGFVATTSVSTLVYMIWIACEEQLKRGTPDDGRNQGPSQTVFYCVVRFPCSLQPGKSVLTMHRPLRSL